MDKSSVLIEVNHLKKHFPVGKNKMLQAIDDVSFHIHRGETLGLVGESGCGKSTLGRTLIQLYEPDSGEIIFDGQKLNSNAGVTERREYTRKMQMIYQDPYSSLNARMTVMEIISEGLIVHRPGLLKEERRRRVIELLELVGLSPKHVNRYPHEFSGGQRQRIGIARALAVEPQFIVADEPIAALDVSIQAQIVNLLKQLQREKQLTYLFIAHDLSMVKYISDRIAVMYLGQLMELVHSEELYRRPLHPYTEALLSAIPIPDPRLELSRERIVLQGDVPNPITPPSGCRFHTRCPKVMDICSTVQPQFTEAAPYHYVRCHLYGSKEVVACPE
ncbi:oligopeptide/dipeptide ABC transporter ATP-binding protein [Paenibacillus forsythiae]|uniref:Oligopeptide/dipeptide ABC transporter ATP-binding protein n=1 Tax=Paenibacillus forsythiae TaxID=365616 RepID=A0ABU3H2C8_9BACL|nr:oligopeptide/dipeptide ABC transporter ATP-binding protein [Paenibacillus forsythiae]MDT3424972.1 oligopeptide/dipeptide ABC transporter ATP-binding protein [Paenibacillus forsythiae]